MSSRMLLCGRTASSPFDFCVCLEMAVQKEREGRLLSIEFYTMRMLALLSMDWTNVAVSPGQWSRSARYMPSLTREARFPSSLRTLPISIHSPCISAVRCPRESVVLCGMEPAANVALGSLGRLSGLRCSCLSAHAAATYFLRQPHGGARSPSHSGHPLCSAKRRLAK